MPETPPAVADTSPAPEPVVSIADHAASFSPESREQIAASDAEAPPNETPAQAQQRRDKATGQYRDGKVRHRAKSQQASPADVPRIRELTARAKTAEERVAALEKAQATPAPAARPVAPEPQRFFPPAQGADPEPTLQAFIGKSEDPYGAHNRALVKWELRQEETRRVAAWQQQQAQHAEHQKNATFVQRMQAAQQKHPDYTQVAFAPTPIQIGSIVDTFIREDDAGAEILYYLHQHRDELASLLAGSALQQARKLSLLSQRLLSETTPVAAGSNGAAPRSTPVIAPPKPSTPLRTEAQRPAPQAPPTDGSLSIREHAKAFGRSR